jgi:hypothetical protein
MTGVARENMTRRHRLNKKPRRGAKTEEGRRRGVVLGRISELSVEQDACVTQWPAAVWRL